MYFCIETKRGVQLTFTSANHNATEKRTRPGAGSFAPSELKPTFVVQDAYCKPARHSLGPYDIAKNICVEPNRTPTPYRTQSSRNPFRWLRFHRSRRSRFDNKCPPYNEEHKALPPPYHNQEREFSLSKAQELPGEWERLEMYDTQVPLEMSCPIPSTIQGYGMDINKDPYALLKPNGADKWDHANTGYYHQQVPTPLRMPDDHTNRVTPPQPYAVPPMTRDGSSVESSPVSFNSPGQGGNYGVFQPYGPGLVNGDVSPWDSSMTGGGVFAADGFQYSAPQQYSPLSAFAQSINSGSAELFSPPPPQFSGPHPDGIENLPGRPEFQEPSDEILPSQELDLSVEQFQHESPDPRVGTFELNDSMWTRLPARWRGVENTGDQVNQQLLNDSQQAHSQFDNAEQQSSQRETEVKKVACNKCGEQFKGRYRNGNLRRHVKAIHDKVQSKCQMCGRKFNRADAARKHERLSCKHK